MRIDVYDGNTPMLGVLYAVAPNVALEQMSITGSIVQKNSQKRMKSASNRHHWHQENIHGTLQPYYDRTATKELGQRTKKDESVDNPDSMGEMIHSVLFEKSKTLVVNGTHPAIVPIERKDGVNIGFMKRLAPITPHTQSIIHKLDTGERTKDHGWGFKGKEKRPFFPNATFKGRGFMVAGFADSRASAIEQLTDAYIKKVGRAVNKAELKIVETKRKVV